MSFKDVLEVASFGVTVIGLPFAIGVFLFEQRRERENEEEEGYQLLSNAYNDFLKIVLDNADLRLRTATPLPDPTPEQTERRRWNSWDDYIREWCRRDDFFNALPLMLRGEDPAFQAYVRCVAMEVRPGSIIAT